MTIDSAVEISRDLGHNPDWPLFSGRGAVAQQQAALAACTLTWRLARAENSYLMSRARRDLERSLAHLAASLGYAVQMFVVHATLQPKSSIVMHRRLWRAEALRAMPAGIEQGAEVKIECGNKVRFVGLATVPLTDIPWVVANLDAFETIVPLLSRTELPMDEDTVAGLGCAAFPPAGCADRSDVDWASFAHYIVSAGGVCVRWSRDLSIPELAADLFVPDAEVEKIKDVLYRAH